MSKDMVGTKSRIVIEKYRKGELVERREVGNILLEYGASRIASLVYAHDEYLWSQLDIVNMLGLGDANKNIIKTLTNGSISIQNDTAGRKYVVEVSWTDSSTDEYTVYHVSLHHARAPANPGAPMEPIAFHFATLPSPLSKAADDVVRYKWVIEIPYGVT